MSVTSIMAEIEAASREQNSGIEEVSDAMAQMDKITQQNAALAEESSGAAEAMRQNAERLVEAVSLFKTNATSSEIRAHADSLLLLGVRKEPA